MQSYEPIHLLILNYIAQKARNYFCWLSSLSWPTANFFQYAYHWCRRYLYARFWPCKYISIDLYSLRSWKQFLLTQHFRVGRLPIFFTLHNCGLGGICMRSFSPLGQTVLKCIDGNQVSGKRIRITRKRQLLKKLQGSTKREAGKLLLPWQFWIGQLSIFFENAKYHCRMYLFGRYWPCNSLSIEVLSLTSLNMFLLTQQF